MVFFDRRWVGSKREIFEWIQIECINVFPFIVVILGVVVVT